MSDQEMMPEAATTKYFKYIRYLQWLYLATKNGKFYNTLLPYCMNKWYLIIAKIVSSSLVVNNRYVKNGLGHWYIFVTTNTDDN